MTTVSLFLATTKSGGDGTYTKKGNYICLDSDECNTISMLSALYMPF
ncbi:hypothetical protein ACWN8M_02160 [Pseudolactococcus reticulitermitis]